MTVHNDLTGRSASDAHPTSAVTGLDTALAGKAATVHSHVTSDVTGLDEQVRDVVGTALVAGSNVTITVDDPSDTITIAAAGAVSFVNGETGVVVLDASDVGAAATSHSHSGADITSGTVPFAQLPTGTGSSQVAVGDHTHTTYVPTTRTVNGHALSGDVTLTAADIGLDEGNIILLSQVFGG